MIADFQDQKLIKYQEEEVIKYYLIARFTVTKAFARPYFKCFIRIS